MHGSDVATHTAANACDSLASRAHLDTGLPVVPVHVFLKELVVLCLTGRLGHVHGSWLVNRLLWGLRRVLVDHSCWNLWLVVDIGVDSWDSTVIILINRA